MRVIRARSAGFCMGVGLALKKLENAIENQAAEPERGRICTFGPIIHNPQVLAHFESLGVHCLNSIAEADSGDHVLIRAHGVPRDIEDELRRNCGQVRDATCPKVKKAQLAIAQATAGGAMLLLFGEADHPEVAGLVSYAAGAAHVFNSRDELDRLNIQAGKPYVLAAQTTQDSGVFAQIRDELASRVPDLVVLATICDATGQRQAEALRIARAADKMVVVGGRSSGNTRRLAGIAANAGIRTFHIEDASELDASQFSPGDTVGLTAGASTPGPLIDDVENWLMNIV